MKRFISALSFVLVIVALVAAPVMADGVLVTTGKSFKHDTSPPLRDIMVAAPASALAGFNVEIPIAARPGGAARADVPQGPDGSLQDRFRPVPGASPTPPVDMSFSGLSDDDNGDLLGFRIVPPDTNGDIGFDDTGKKVYMQYINLIWAVYDAADGSVISGPNLGNSFWTGFGGVCETNNNGDPVALYDDAAGRWFVSQFSINEGIQCAAVSVTSDPLGAYHRYAFTVTPGGANDYPKLGVWYDEGGQSSYTFTMRDFGGAGGSFSNSAGVMERDMMLDGNAAQFVKFSNPCVGGDCIEGQLPPHMAGPAPPADTCPTFWGIADAQFDDTPHLMDGARNYELCVDWATIGNSTYSENAFAGGVDFDRGLGNGFSSCITPIMGGGSALDCLAIFTMYRAQYRYNGSHATVLLNTTIDDGTSRAGIHWMELRSTDGQTGWSIFQEGSYAPADDVDRWMGSIGMDGDGNIALGYSAVSGTLFPAVRYTTRMASSPLGVLDGGEESCIEGTGAQTGASRWGDYSSMSIDPEDDCTFWYTTEYQEVTGGFDFNTRVCSFKLADCGGGQPTFTLFAPTPGNAGVLNTFATTGATPNSKVNFVGGSAAGSTVFNVPNCGAISMDVGGNTRRLGFDTANGSGENDLMRVIPGSQAGNTVHLQAIDQATCTKSNVVVHTF